MKKSTFTIFLVLCSCFCFILASAAARAETISFGCPAWGFCNHFQATGDIWAKNTGNTLKMYESGRLVDDSLGLFRQILSAKSDEFDIILIDCIWPGMLGKHLVDLRSFFSQSDIDKHFKPIISNYMDEHGSLLAIPLFTDAGILYYRKDLLDKYGFSPPETWEELSLIAQKIVQSEKESTPGITGFVWQGKAYEGLTCNALEWINSFGGGAIIDDKTGEVTVNNPNAVKALKTAASWIGSISPKDVLEYTELETTNHFRSGKAVFMRNWMEPWAACDTPDSPVKGKIGLVALPKGGNDGKHAGTIGDMSLAVSKYSRNPEKSADLVKFISSAQSQKRHAIEYSFSPTLITLYDDPELLEKRPFMAALKDVLLNGVERPSRLTGIKYAKISSKFSEAVYMVISGKAFAETELANLEKELNKIKNGHW